MAVLALFTRNHLFWVAALVLALVRIPDFISPINSIASSLRSMIETASDAEAATEAPDIAKREQ